jgi:hypothetical protein
MWGRATSPVPTILRSDVEANPESSVFLRVLCGSRPFADFSSVTSASQSANAFGVDTPISGVTTTIAIAAKSARG